MTQSKRSQSHFKQQLHDYLSDSKSIVEECITATASAPQFQEIFRASLATESVLAGLGTPNLKPSLAPARNIVLRVPMLTAVGQAAIAKAELRRFLELLFWTIYFTDHLVEWAEFKNESNAGFARDQRRPITYAAHRELAFYVDYARERMEAELSGLGTPALDELKQANHQLNAAVHAGGLAKAKRKSAPFENPDSKLLQGFGKLQRTVFANACILLAAYRPEQFGRLSAMARAQFDWLIGASLRKKVRSGPFGLR